MNQVQKVIAAREAAQVKRGHTYFSFQQDTVGVHSFNMLNLLFALHPEPSSNLIRAVLFHDIAERYAGDIPGPAKRASPELKKASQALEASVENALDMHVDLSEDERRWLKGVDKLEFYMWASEEAAMGNYQVAGKAEAMKEGLLSDPRTPQAVKDFAMEYKPQVLPDLSELLQPVGSNGRGR